MRKTGESRKGTALRDTNGAPKMRIGFVLTPCFTLTAFAAFVDALRLAADEADRSRPIEVEWAVLGDRDRMTSAGGTSVVHLAAHLIALHFGRAHANKCLRIMIEDQPLTSNTSQPESVVTRQARDNLVRRAMLLIEQKLSEPDLLLD